MSAWIVILAVGLGNYLFRLSMTCSSTGSRCRPNSIEPLTRRTGRIRRVGGGRRRDSLHKRWRKPATTPLAAVAAAVIAVLRTGSSYAAILVGMPTLWIMTSLLSG
jgi:hypothetical protein